MVSGRCLSLVNRTKNQLKPKGSAPAQQRTSGVFPPDTWGALERAFLELCWRNKNPSMDRAQWLSGKEKLQPTQEYRHNRIEVCSIS